MTAAMTRTVAGETLPAAGIWTLDPSHSSVAFSVRHLGLSKVRGRFSSFTGDVVIAEDPMRSSVEVRIDVASIDTRDEKRDEHLRSNDFFGTGDHPKLVFASTRVEHLPGPTFRVHGDLTIKGIARPVILDATFNGSGVNPWGQTVASWSATTEIDREEWGMTFNSTLETGGVLVGKRITIELEVQAVQA